jgi:hypothetical protein
MVRTVDLGRAENEVGEGESEQGGDFLPRPIASY